MSHRFHFTDRSVASSARHAKGSAYGSGTKYIVRLMAEGLDDEIIPVHPRRHTVRIFRGFRFTPESLESREALEMFLLESPVEGNLRCTDLEACERTGWIIHAYCIMGNHYHLALETPSPNLSDGMKWLQGVYATRYNRFRKEQGHLFQGRFKSIVLEDFERLAGLSHYIHLNPVIAGIVDVVGLAGYRFSSYYWLNNRKGRRPFLSFDACLEGSGGLKNTLAGRRKYSQYLAWLNEDEPQQKTHLFDCMSRGWAHGTKEFRKALIRDGKKERLHLQHGGTGSREALELVWEDDLERCLEVLGKSLSDATTESKSADWKTAICAWMRRRHLCRNRWLSEKLSMGVEAAVSRYVKQCNDGERSGAGKLLKQLNARTKN